MNELSPIWLGVGVGLLLSFLNIAAGFVVARRAQRLPVNKATMLVLSAMALRLVVMVVLIGIAVSLLPLDRLAFALTLMVSFFVMVMVEAFFLHAHHERTKQPIVRRRRYRRTITFTVICL